MCFLHCTPKRELLSLFVRVCVCVCVCFPLKDICRPQQFQKCDYNVQKSSSVRRCISHADRLYYALSAFMQSLHLYSLEEMIISPLISTELLASTMSVARSRLLLPPRPLLLMVMRTSRPNREHEQQT